MMAELTPREWEILNRRFNLDEPMGKVADRFKITKQRVKAIEDRSIKNIMIAFGEIEIEKKEVEEIKVVRRKIKGEKDVIIDI